MSIEEYLKISQEKNENKIDSFKNSSEKMKLGIMGGTFNPIHNAHIMVAEYIMSYLGLDKIVFIPNGDPPHKNKTLDKNHRYNMVLLSIVKNDDFFVSDYEISQKKNKKVYTVDTLRHITEFYPEKEIYFITGSDAINQIESWKDFRQNFKYANFVVALRPGIDEKMTLENVERFRKEYEANISVIYVPQMDISSTNIRTMARNDEQIKGLVPSKVWEYINKMSLYGGAKG